MSMPINYLIYFTWSENFLLLFYYIFNILTNIIFLLLTIALFTVVERKIMAALQKRKGPNVHGFWGSLQAFSDGLKLLLKEDFVPSIANTFLFRIAPIYTFFIALSSWAIIPFSNTQGYFFSNLGILYVFALSSLGVYGIILSGWASNSKYSFLGALRSAAQMISYEVSIGFVIITICMICGTLSLVKIVVDQFFFWFLVPFFPLFLIFLISIVAETNRAPFDLPEAEAELVSGYNVEYGGISFALFFLAEYSNIILMSTLTVLLFMGGWWPLFQSFFIFDSFFNFFFIFWLSLKLQIILGLFVWLRVSFPRYRYDQLMLLGWNVLLPWSLSLFFSYSFFIFYYDAVPSYNISYFSYIPTYNFFCFDLNEYYSERYSELDCKNINDLTLKNATYEDVLKYNEEKTFKYYHIFERINWQKYLYLDVKAKYLNLFNNDTFCFFNVFYKENFEFFENLNQTFIKYFSNFSVNNSLNYFFFDSSFVTKYSIKLFFDNFLYNNNITFISIKQCFSFLCDPSFNIVDAYARGIFFDFSQNILNWSSTEKISYAVLRDCHNVWWSFYNFLAPFKTLQIYSFLPLSNKLLYFFKYDIATLPLNFQFEYLQIKQSVLTLLILLDKFRVLDFFMLTNIEKFNKILILFPQPSLYIEDDLEIYSEIFSVLFKKIEPFSNFIAMKYKDVFESSNTYNLIEKNNLNININITLKK